MRCVLDRSRADASFGSGAHSSVVAICKRQGQDTDTDKVKTTRPHDGIDTRYRDVRSRYVTYVRTDRTDRSFHTNTGNNSYDNQTDYTESLRMKSIIIHYENTQPSHQHDSKRNEHTTTTKLNDKNKTTKRKYCHTPSTLLFKHGFVCSFLVFLFVLVCFWIHF